VQSCGGFIADGAVLAIFQSSSASLTQYLRQLHEVRSNPPRFVFAEQLGNPAARTSVTLVRRFCEKVVCGDFAKRHRL
jgi:hypothetical protein